MHDAGLGASQRAAGGTEHRGVTGHVVIHSLHGCFVLVIESALLAEDEPRGWPKAAPRLEHRPALVSLDPPDEVHCAAPLARPDLEDRGVAVGTRLMAGEVDVRPGIRQAGERPSVARRNRW